MPKSSTWTELLGPALVEQLDAVGEALKELIGWPPLGVAELSPSGARGREKADAEMLADLFARVGPEMAMGLVASHGQGLMDRFGPGVVQGAIRIASKQMDRETGNDGREAFMEGGE